jgi:preprotein translocase subunit SecG
MSTAPVCFLFTALMISRGSRPVPLSSEDAGPFPQDSDDWAKRLHFNADAPKAHRTMLAFFTTVHVLLCIFMIFVILLQPGKDAGMGAALGGGAATSAFGGRGAITFLGKVTAVCAVAFFVTSLGLSLVGLRTSVVSKSSLVAKQQQEAEKAKAEADAKAKEAEKTDAEKAPGTTVPPVDTAGKGDPTVPPPPTPPSSGPRGTDAVPSEKFPPKP